MTDWRSKRYSRLSSIARGLASDRRWGLPPAENPEKRRREEVLYENRDLTGTVIRFDDRHQFGFAEFEGVSSDRGSRGVFVHNDDVTSPHGGKMREGVRIIASITRTERGPRAVNIRMLRN